MKSSDITKNCVFLQLNLSRLGDKRGVSSDDVEVDADKDLVKVRKVIFKSDLFNAIKTFDRQTKNHVKGMGFPFEKGFFLYPIKAVADTEEYLVERLRKRQEELVPAFAEIVPSLIQNMPKALRVLFKEDDYKKFDHVADEFAMYWQWMAFSAPFELNEISPEAFKTAKKKWNDRLERAFEETRFLYREVFLDLITTLRDNLEPDAHGGHKRLSSSSITHLRKFIADSPIRNVTDDREMERWAGQLENLMNSDIEAFREHEGFRAQVHGQLQAIEKALGDSIQIAPKRRIKI